MFSRTKYGLSNEHLFYDVDVIVYCEGPSTEDETLTFDEMFWRSVLSSKNIKCKCKGMGRKSYLLDLARQIVEDGAKSIIIALDRDYDEFLGKIFDHPQVFYSYGYSWESDVIVEFDFKHMLQVFANVANPEEFSERFYHYLDSQRSDLKRICALDIKYITKKNALFNRDRPQSVLLNDKKRPPCINKNWILSQARKWGDIKAHLYQRKHI